MNWNCGIERPETRTLVRRLGQPVYTANVFIEKTGEENQPYRWLSVTLPPAVWDRGAIIDGIVRAKYTESQMEAIHNNYLLALADGNAGSGAFDEFKEMQEWRRAAKEEAKRIYTEYVSEM